MPDTRVVGSLAAVDRAAWNGLFGGTLEDYDYLMAVEMAQLEGFRCRYVLVSDGETLLAAAPAFLTEYALETTLVGPGKQLLGAVRRVLPGALKLRLACIGSPCTTTAGLGLSPRLIDRERQGALAALLRAFEAEAISERCSLFGLKDVPAPDRALWDATAAPMGYRPMPSLPLASLAIDFASENEYLSRLSYTARKDMRRKLRARSQVGIELRDNVDDVIDRLMALYAQTRARADMSFEHLSAEYFRGVPRQMGKRAFYVLYFQNDDLLAANLLLQDETTLLDKYFLMDAERGRALNLYFLSWFTNVGLCLARGLTSYQSGQAAYENKLRLGSRLTRTSIYFRHRNGLLNAGMQLFAPLFAADPTLKMAA
jgi:hypothetical protein